MALKIRLRKQGRKDRSFFRLVVVDVRVKRDGQYREALGWYNPHEADQEKGMHLEEDRLHYWIDQGAQFSENAKDLVARIAPAVVQKVDGKKIAQRAKIAEKRKARKKAKAA